MKGKCYHNMIFKDPVSNYYQPGWGTYRAGGVLTQLLDIKIDDATEAVTVLFANGLIVDNLLERRMEGNMNPVRPCVKQYADKKRRDFLIFFKREIEM